MTSRVTLPVKLTMLGLVPLSAIAGLSAWRVLDDFAAADTLTAQADEVRRVDQIGRIIDDADDEIQTLNEIGASAEDLIAQRARVDVALDELLDNPNGTSAATLQRVAEFRGRIGALRSSIPSSPSAYRLSGAATGRHVFDHGNGGVDAMSPEALAIFAATQEFSAFTDSLRDDTRFNDDLFRDGGIAADVSTLQLFDLLAERLDAERQIYVEMASLPASVRTDDVLATGREIGRSAQFWNEAVDEIGADDMLGAFADLRSSDAAEKVEATRALMAGLVLGQPLAVSAADIEDAFVDLDTQISTVRSDLSSEMISEVDAIRSTAVRSAYITMAIAALFVGGAALLIYLLYLSIRRPLRSVTRRSIEVATVQLPAAVASLRDDADRPEVEPIEVTTRDEIGQLVEAFNTMSATALKLAGEQAMARRSVGDMFMNLGRRNQKLLNRLLRNLDQLQRDEREPQALQALYEIDHLTTRMRRNAESLLILAGAEQTRRFTSPVTAGDIIRAAMSEVEHYERVEIVGDTSQRIQGELVADLTHLLAELIENGLAFSPPETTVQVTARMTHRGYMFAVSDDGVGMTAEKIEEANTRISVAATQEETPSKFLGLFVVGRLAVRRDIDVRIFDSPTGGVVVRLALPDDALFVDQDASFVPDDLSSIDDSAAAPDAIANTAPATESLSESLRTTLVSRQPEVADALSAPTLTSLDNIAAEHRPAVRAALESIGQISAVMPNLDAQRDVLLGNPAQPLTAPAGSALPAPVPRNPNKFGGFARRPGTNLAMARWVSGEESAESTSQSDRTPDVVRQSLSGFQSGTSRADQQGVEQ